MKKNDESSLYYFYTTLFWLCSKFLLVKEFNKVSYFLFLIRLTTFFLKVAFTKTHCLFLIFFIF